MSTKPRKLSNTEFLEVISRTPLVAIDLVIRDPENNILLGRRINEPAKGKWFVPGGRILKGESLEAAFERISVAEIGERHFRSEARLIGVFTHNYDTNYFLVDGVTTHYVVLAFELRVNKRFKISTSKQHDEFNWFSHRSQDSDIHEYTLAYFNHPSQMDKDQYNLLNARRDTYDNLVWQTPLLSLTAQAFLFTIILSEGNGPIINRIIAAVLACITAIASLQLLGKHRFMEESHRKILQGYEEANCQYAPNQKPKPSSRLLRCSSYKIWMAVLMSFAIAAIFSIFRILLKQ